MRKLNSTSDFNATYTILEFLVMKNLNIYEGYTPQFLILYYVFEPDLRRGSITFCWYSTSSNVYSLTYVFIYKENSLCVSQRF